MRSLPKYPSSVYSTFREFTDPNLSLLGFYWSMGRCSTSTVFTVFISSQRNNYFITFSDDYLDLKTFYFF